MGSEGCGNEALEARLRENQKHAKQVADRPAPEPLVYETLLAGLRQLSHEHDQILLKVLEASHGVLLSRKNRINIHTFKCSDTASVIVEAATGHCFSQPPLKSNEGAVGGLFKGASYINLEDGTYGHRLAVIHCNDHHKIVQSNALEDNDNVSFSCQLYLESPAGALKVEEEDLDQRLTEWMSTSEYMKWLKELRENEGSLEETRRLTGVGVRATLYVQTLQASDRHLLSSHSVSVLGRIVNVLKRCVVS